MVLFKGRDRNDYRLLSTVICICIFGSLVFGISGTVLICRSKELLVFDLSIPRNSGSSGGSWVHPLPSYMQGNWYNGVFRVMFKGLLRLRSFSDGFCAVPLESTYSSMYHNGCLRIRVPRVTWKSRSLCWINRVT